MQKTQGRTEKIDMIKKLQKKFVLINMCLISAVILGILIILCVSNYQKFKSDASEALNFALREDRGSLMPRMELPPPDGLHGGMERQLNGNPVFVIDLDAWGEMTGIDESGMQVDEEAAEAALEAAEESGKDFGILWKLCLRYKRQTHAEGSRIAFMDCSREIEGMRNLLIMSVLAFLGSMVAFLGISIFLARWALAPVEKAWQQQRRFIADASHELKTPLTVILANLGILASHKEDTIANQYKWLSNTRTEAKRMQKLLEDLLFLARTDSAAAPMVFGEMDFSTVLWSCILPFESLAYENNVTLLEEIEPEIKLTGDENQLKQMIAILMDNACKYVEKGGTIKVRLLREQEKIRLFVSNTGTVIPKEEAEHIFERFYRVDKSRVRKENGYGLGLSIAETIVHSHHGKIKVSSGDGRTTFAVSFPV